MRTLCAVLCVLCALSSSASAQNAGDMLRACELLERGIHVEKNGTVYIPSGPSSISAGALLKLSSSSRRLLTRTEKSCSIAAPIRRPTPRKFYTCS